MTLEVVWNGALDRSWAVQQRPVTRIEPSPYRRLWLAPTTRMHSITAAQVNRGSARTCDRLLVYLLDHAAVWHTGASVGQALGLPRADAASYLRRHAARGLLTRSTRHGVCVFRLTTMCRTER